MSSLSLGIVGLPNVGKSTLFNALVKNGAAVASNYPFCTIDPNVGIVEVPDSRLGALSSLVKPEKIIPAVVEFYDIAGIIKGAATGEGLGNKFLSHIRETAAIILVARFFDHPDIIHVNGSIDPKRDLETVIIELILADLETVAKARDRYQKAARGGDADAKAAITLIDSLEQALGQEKRADSVFKNLPTGVSDEVAALVNRELHLLTAKPMLIVANVGEEDITTTAQSIFESYQLESIVPSAQWIIPICAQLEAELSTLSPEEQLDFLQSYHLTESGLTRLVQQAYSLLNLETFLTAGPQEVRAWTMPKGSKAPQAAGVIHTDFEKGFIRAEVIAFDDYMKFNGETGAKEAGKLRSEGKEYVMHDGDVVHFRFNV